MKLQCLCYGQEEIDVVYFVSVCGIYSYCLVIMIP